MAKSSARAAFASATLWNRCDVRVMGSDPGPLLRDRFPILERRTYLNSCSQGALSADVRRAYEQYLADWDEYGSPWELWVEKTDDARARFAQLVGAEPDDVAVTTSVSAAVSSLASGLSFDRGRSKVVLSDVEFPTVGQIWHAQEVRGARVVHTSDWEREIDDDTLLVSLTHVSYRTGERLPIEDVTRLARERGALVLLDAYQSAGSIPLDVTALDVDFLAAGALKYLLASAGLAFLYARKPVDAIRPTATGWFADEDVFAMDDRDYSPAPTAARFQSGTPPVPSLYAGIAAIDLVLEAGVERTQKHVAELTSAFVDGVRELGGTIITPERRGALVCVGADDPPRLERALAAEGIVTSWRDRSVRFSFHFYNDEEDVAAALAALERQMSR
jgi:selenocysteine lyase/cysteine desulfurase